MSNRKRQGEWRACSPAWPIPGDLVRITEKTGDITTTVEATLHTETYVQGVRTWRAKTGQLIYRFTFQSTGTVEFKAQREQEKLWNG